ncbi:60 kDa chaperonin [Frankliniella fusca]|uniref:60 kDa chaperonin n=1 Tax=Frankliniella fusca TaxID=407009 RepID=A0AAE1GRY8_9NEOP|nr:60 kDa chaperonin [Frankliniella fusca]
MEHGHISCKREGTTKRSRVSRESGAAVVLPLNGVLLQRVQLQLQRAVQLQALLWSLWCGAAAAPETPVSVPAAAGLGPGLGLPPFPRLRQLPIGKATYF